MTSHRSRRFSALLGLAILLATVAASTATAQVIERREGEANPMVAVFKSTVYGAGAGLVLGLAVELIASDADGEALRWGFVAGTFVGFGYGLYHVMSRPEPTGAFLEGRAEGWALAVPRPELVFERSDPRGAPATNLEIRAPLVAFRF